MYIWNNTRGLADQYFLVHKEKVLFQIPNVIGRLLIGKGCR